MDPGRTGAERQGAQRAGSVRARTKRAQHARRAPGRPAQGPGRNPGRDRGPGGRGAHRASAPCTRARTSRARSARRAPGRPARPSRAGVARPAASARPPRSLCPWIPPCLARAAHRVWIGFRVVSRGASATSPAGQRGAAGPPGSLLNRLWPQRGQGAWRRGHLWAKRRRRRRSAAARGCPWGPGPGRSCCCAGRRRGRHRGPRRSATAPRRSPAPRLPPWPARPGTERLHRGARRRGGPLNVGRSSGASCAEACLFRPAGY